MLSRLFSRRAVPPATASSNVPDGSRVYAIGDIHGCVGLLKKLHALILEDAASHTGDRKVVIYLGDYIDRGPDSRAVVDLLIDEPLSGFESIHLKGNHEEILLRFLEDARVGADWLAYGGDATLYSYGVQPPDHAAANDILSAQKSLSDRLPTPHADFFRSLKIMHSEGGYAIVHAGVRANVPIEQQSVQDMLWIRDAFLESQADFGKIVVHGHSIEEAPMMRRNRIGIDTGAFATGILTCLVLEGCGRRFLST